MSKFFVGQRVRIVGFDTGSKIGPRLIGREGVVDETSCRNILGEAGRIGVTVLDSGSYCFRPYQLEPILPDGHRAGEEGKCELLDELLERQREAA